MQEKEWEFAGGSLHYEVRGQSVHILRASGQAVEIKVPESVEGYPVEVIEKKAFLSRKNLRRIELPDTVREVGDWAFAYCDGLREVKLPRKDVGFGRSVFLECGGLRRIALREQAAETEKTGGKGTPGQQGCSGYICTAQGTAELLAAAVVSLDAYYLLELPAAGNEEWLKKWDGRLLTVLHTPDQDGFSKQVLCGEEDYGSTDLAAYIGGKRRLKSRLSLLRLLFPEGLPEETERELKQYLLDHTKGGESEEAWRVILEQYGDDKAYYSLFAGLGCVTTENLDGILADIGERFPEMKAYFLRYKEEKLGIADFFDSLQL